MFETRLFRSISIVTLGVLCMAGSCMLQAQTAVGQEIGQEKRGVTPHAPLLKMVVPGTANQEVAVYETEYAPGGINPRHLHPAAITFHVLSGTGVWQEEGKPPVTLKAGESLFVPAGTIHSHWNPSSTDGLRFWNSWCPKRTKGDLFPTHERPSLN
jgi:quercetin dioxygenase-like cupin family protein